MIDENDFLTTARHRYDIGKQDDSLDREAAEDDNKFGYADDINLEQWTKKAKDARVNRPVLQWNRLPTFLHQVVNPGRQNKPAIKISPQDETPQETAEMLQGRIRHIEYETNADTARDRAREQQAATGRGFIQVGLEWIPGKQQQRITVSPIENQFSVVWDAGGRKYDRTDADYCFVISHYSKDAYIRRFGKKAYQNRMDFVGIDDPAPEWIVGEGGEKLQVADYWLKEYSTVKVAAEGGQPARAEQTATITCYIIDGAQVLEEYEWIGSTIPIVPQWGEEYVENNIPRTRSLWRDAKTPQRNANLAISNLSEQIGQMPKSPYLIPGGGIAANHEDDWANALNTPLHALYYQQWDEQGRPLNTPQRNTQEPPIQACLEFLHESFDAIKAAMGIFDDSLGNAPSAKSGIAIQKQNAQAGVANAHFAGNEARSNKYFGEILVELIKKIDLPGKSYPIRTVDGKTHMVPIGKPHRDWKTGETVTHDLESAQVGVSVSTGPSYEAARQEAYDRDAAMIQAQPELMFVIGDQLFANDDTAGAEDRSDRLKRYIEMKNPGLIQDKQKGPPIPPQVQQQLQAQGQELQKAHAFAQSLHEQIQTKQPELQQKQTQAQMDDATKRYICDQQEATKREIALMQINAQAAQMKLEQQLGIISDKLDRFHELNQQAADHKHQVTQAQASQQAAADTQDSAQQFQAQQSQAAQQQGE